MLEQLFSAWGVWPTGEAWQNFGGVWRFKTLRPILVEKYKDSRAESVADDFSKIKNQGQFQMIAFFSLH